LPRNGFGIRFAGCTDSSGAPATCPQGTGYVGVDSAITVAGYTENDSFNGGSLKVVGYNGVKEAAAGQINHYEVQVSQSDIEVYGTDAFSGTWDPAASPLVHIASIPKANLSFTRGLVWIEDAHYNGNKFNTQGLHTFRWANVGFDGPVVLARDLGFDVPANNVPEAGTGGNGDPGLLTYYNTPTALTMTGVTGSDIAAASAALLVFNFWSIDSLWPPQLHVVVNGHDITESLPDNPIWNSPSTLAIPVPLADLVAGTNTATFADLGGTTEVGDVDLILAGAGGTVQP
jgi:hypothetical protein